MTGAGTPGAGVLLAIIVPPPIISGSAAGAGAAEATIVRPPAAAGAGLSGGGALATIVRAPPGDGAGGGPFGAALELAIIVPPPAVALGSETTVPEFILGSAIESLVGRESLGRESLGR